MELEPRVNPAELPPRGGRPGVSSPDLAVPAPGEVPAFDFAKAQKRSQTFLWGTAIFAVLAIIAILYGYYTSVVSPLKTQIEASRSQIGQLKSKYDADKKKQEALPYLKVLQKAVNDKWQFVLAEDVPEKRRWFFKSYWEVLDHFGQNWVDTCEISYVVPIELKLKLLENRDWTYEHTWTARKMSEISTKWRQLDQTQKVRISETGMAITGNDLLIALPFEMKVAGEYQSIKDFLDNMFYHSPYFMAIFSIKLSYISEMTTIGSFQPVGTMELAEMKGAYFYLNPTGAPNTSFLPAQMGGGAVGGGGGGPTTGGLAPIGM